MAVTRFGVSLEEELLKTLDEYVEENGFPNRSQAIRHLVQNNLVEKKWKCDNVVAGAITLVYPFNRKEIQARSASVQHEFRDVIMAVQSFHISESNFLEIVAVKGTSRRLTAFSDKLISIKGIQHGKLIMSKAE
jgi:CopG family transcriptional regulator, nickel-responsive regulator